MTSYEKKRDCIFSLVATAGSAFGLVQAFGYPPESSGFPKFLLWMMLLFSVLLLIKNFRARVVEENGASAAQTADFFHSLRVASIVVTATVGYILGILYIGYFVSTAVFFLAAMIGYGKNRPLVSVLSLAGFLAVMYALFIWFLGMRLPSGLLV